MPVINLYAYHISVAKRKDQQCYVIRQDLLSSCSLIFLLSPQYPRVCCLCGYVGADGSYLCDYMKRITYPLTGQ